MLYYVWILVVIIGIGWISPSIRGIVKQVGADLVGRILHEREIWKKISKTDSESLRL